MSQKAIREFDGKNILAKWLGSRQAPIVTPLCAQVTAETDLSSLHYQAGNEWLNTMKLVTKPDQLIKRRGKAGLVGLNLNYDGAISWIKQRMDTTVSVGKTSGTLDTFIIEPFLPHKQEQEFYICIYTTRDGDDILFHHEGGVDIGDVDAKATKVTVPVLGELSAELLSTLLADAPTHAQRALRSFIAHLYNAFKELHFAYLEINPLVAVTAADGVTTLLPNVDPDAAAAGEVLGFAVLDLAAKLDETAQFEVGKHWGEIEFPAPFGQATPTIEEQRVHALDGKTGASMKLTVLNARGRIWLMTAGGGASVIMSDTVADYGYGHELANYGEYSGAPTTSQTYEYACAVLSLMTKEPHPQGKLLLIGGGIANFTDVAATFKGIIKALTEYQHVLRSQNVRIFVRRAGPNYQEGLKLMREALVKLSLEGQVFGPELHMTSIIPLALGLPVPSTDEYQHVPQPLSPAPSMLPRTLSLSTSSHAPQQQAQKTATAAPAAVAAAPVLTAGVIPGTPSPTDAATALRTHSEEAKTVDTAAVRLTAAAAKEVPLTYPDHSLFTPRTRAVVYGLQLGAVQNMLDFDYISGRAKPSVACIVYPFQGDHYVKVYWNDKEILLPCMQSLANALKRFPDVDTVVNFSSFRSVYETSMEVLSFPSIRCLSIIAEGVPERRARELLHRAQKQGTVLIGPATVGGIKPGCFRIGNAGGALDNIVAARLYRPGSVAYVTRSGGMSNELNHMLSCAADGVYEGVAIGGDRFPGSTFVDHLLRYEADANVKMVVLLGEVGGTEEMRVCELMRSGRLTKPLVAWCIGTVASIFAHDVQFGHAGACAHSDAETAHAKNRALAAAGAHVPKSFDELPRTINNLYSALVQAGTLVPRLAGPPPAIPVDYVWARKLGLIRKSTSFISSISDERGEELKYAGVPISTVVSDNMGVGGTLGLLWFRKRLPEHFARFIELALVLTADHGPAVSGAHNTIVAARAGKDLVSSLCSGLLTIGPRFGGALDDAARLFSSAVSRGLHADDFVKEMHAKKTLIAGIGHKVKSLEDPDARVAQLKQFAAANIKHTPVLDFACAVERVTTKKKSTLILNVDGAIACVFVDLMRDSGAFTEDEINQYLDMGILNGLFVLGRTIGFVGHYIDQNRFKQPLYRHPHDDISYFEEY